MRSDLFARLACRSGDDLRFLSPAPRKCDGPADPLDDRGRGFYGMVGGTVVGFLTVPATGTLRSAFIGSSVGLYLGVAVGVFYWMERDNPGNPLKRGPQDTLLPQAPGFAVSPGLAVPPDIAAPTLVGEATGPDPRRVPRVRFSFEVARF